MKFAWLLLALLLPPALPAQNTIPAGTILPLRLETTLKTGRIKAGQAIRAEVMQDIPGTRIHRRARVLGHVVSAAPGRLELRFDTLVANGRHIPLKTNLRALASMTEVEIAQTPEGGPDRATPPPFWTTEQIGGEQVYRGGGPVARGLTLVGKPTPYGVLGQLNSSPPCRAEIAGNSAPQALWLFSTDACGLYGFNNLKIGHAGRTEPAGSILLLSKGSKIDLRSGSGLLLRVQGS